MTKAPEAPALDETGAQLLRVGLLLNALQVPAWVEAIIAEVQASDYARIALVVVPNQSPPPAGKHPPFLSRVANAVMRRLVDRLERSFVTRPDAFEPRDVRTLLAGVPVLEADVIRGRLTDTLSESDLERIRQAAPDVLLRFGFRILKGSILSAADAGVWSFHHGDNRVNRGGPAAYWEVHHDWPEIGATLQVLSEDLDGGKVLARTSTTVVRESVRATRNGLYWKASRLMPRMLQKLQRQGLPQFQAEIEQSNKFPLCYSQPLFREPTAGQMAQHAVRNIRRRLHARTLRKACPPQWRLYYAFGKEPLLSGWKFKPLVPPVDRFWADPHIVQRDGRYYAFIEELPNSANKGHISALELTPGCIPGTPRKVLEEPHHLSYPFILEHGGKTYMIPESAQAKTIDLYECVEFPGRWRKVETLFSNVHAVDTTMLFHEGRFWLFTQITEQPGASTGELFLFSSDQLIGGKWLAHGQNPISSEVSRSRPAGGIFSYRGHLYRPSQDCSIRYGYGVRINLIEKLTQSEYFEREVSRIEPLWEEALLATHTFSRCGDLTMLDGLATVKKS